MDLTSLGQRIRRKRQGLEMTQEELAHALGVTPQHISAIEQDKRIPSLHFLAALAEHLGVTIDYLVTGREGDIADAITAIKADLTLSTETKKALITIVRKLRDAASK